LNRKKILLEKGVYNRTRKKDFKCDKRKNLIRRGTSPHKRHSLGGKHRKPQELNREKKNGPLKGLLKRSRKRSKTVGKKRLAGRKETPLVRKKTADS